MVTFECLIVLCIFRATLIGVNSWSAKERDEQRGPICQKSYSPSVFARINYEILRWIKDNTKGACTSEGKELQSYFESETGTGEDLLNEERSQLLDEIKFGLDEIVELQNEEANDNKESEKGAHSTEESDIIQGREL